MNVAVNTTLTFVSESDSERGVDGVDRVLADVDGGVGAAGDQATQERPLAVELGTRLEREREKCFI